LRGAGVHKINSGGKLDLHLDHNVNSRHPGLERRLNLIYWFHPEWQSRWGGNLELWSMDSKSEPLWCEKEVEPKPNRMVLFQTSDISIHGHPTPLRCPKDKSRVSLAVYYYGVAGDTEERRRVKFYSDPTDPKPELDSLRNSRFCGDERSWRVQDA
jgi:Rps23 Pro-64 3,4-dihydroxylase Tpa1-like proline 4-hydroxylase